ncbi:MAG: HAD-IA family hydrolase [Proteobacteria bacterium]|nr:HAD-IA family hydrolase [Pseudomonadota bacterium]
MLKSSNHKRGLVVFDCDGTLVDSQHMILRAMEVAFAAHDLTPPPLEAVRRVVGLSLDQAVARLAGENEVEPALVARLVEDYKGAFHDLRADGGHAQEPLYPGIREALEALSEAGYDLGVATGKSSRGLGKVLELHDISRFFVTVQTADNHPSKPHPAMLEAAIAEAGATARGTVLIGDTSYDILMAQAAGTGALGVAWGYHPPGELTVAGASHIAQAAGDIPALVEEILAPVPAEGRAEERVEGG